MDRTNFWLNCPLDMNDIVIDFDKFPDAVKDALRDQAIREKKPMKVLLAEIIQSTSETIISAAGKDAA